MNKKIKEMLDEFMTFDFQSQGERIEINEYERNILKDYITNLQEELEEEKRIEQESLETIQNLEEEKDTLDDYNRFLHNELKDCQSRIDKEVERLNNIISELEKQ